MIVLVALILKLFYIVIIITAVGTAVGTSVVKLFHKIDMLIDLLPWPVSIYVDQRPNVFIVKLSNTNTLVTRIHIKLSRFVNISFYEECTLCQILPVSNVLTAHPLCR